MQQSNQPHVCLLVSLLKKRAQKCTRKQQVMYCYDIGSHISEALMMLALHLTITQHVGPKPAA
jgi:hypothetical protein